MRVFLKNCAASVYLLVVVASLISQDIPFPSKLGKVPGSNMKRAVPAMPAMKGLKAVGSKNGIDDQDHMKQLMEFVKNENQIEIPEDVKKAAAESVEAFKKVLTDSENSEWLAKVSEKIAFIGASAEQERRFLIASIRRARGQKEMKKNMSELKTAMLEIKDQLKKISKQMEEIVAGLRV
ncbi:hypothetical protein ACFLY6_03400 [Candidatus Dependentiae bacterium]